MARPNRVEIHRDKILIQWDDGHSGVHLSHVLREGCPCAICVDEWTGERRVAPGSIPETIQIMEVNPVGRYAVSIGYSDGHGTGIYRFDILRKMCSCPECLAADGNGREPEK